MGERHATMTYTSDGPVLHGVFHARDEHQIDDVITWLRAMRDLLPPPKEGDAPEGDEISSEYAEKA